MIKRTTTAAALLLTLVTPSLAQTDGVTGEARRFLVYPVQSIIDFAEREAGQFGLSYSVKPTTVSSTKDNSYYFNVNVVRFADEKQAVAGCKELSAWHRSEDYQVTSIAGYSCAFVAEKRTESDYGDGKVVKSQLRTTSYVVGAYFGNLAEGATPPRQEFAPVGPLLAALKGQQPLTSAEAAFRDVVFGGLKFQGSVARSCLDEVMTVAEGESGKDQKMAGDIARLHDAASRVHAIQVLAAVPVGPQNFDDFDPKWWDALKEVVPNPTAAPDPEDSAMDRLVDLLPPPFSTVVNIARTGSKTMRAIKTHIVNPATHGEIYACYRSKRMGNGDITDGMGQDALESAATQVLLDATVNCPNQGAFKSSYEPQLKGFTGQETRSDEFKRLLRPAAVRFEFIYQVEDAKARKDELINARWAPVADVLARLRTRVNACIAGR
jgi:hypothetical protein